MRRFFSFAAVLLVLGLLIGCYAAWENEVHKRAAFDLGCPEDQVQVIMVKKPDIGGGPVYGARGCGKRATYTADTANGVKMNSPVLKEDAATPTPTPTTSNK